MLSDFDKIVSFNKEKEISIQVTTNYVNIPILMDIAYTSWDKDGFEYPYNLFELARNPSIIDILGNL